MPESDEYKMYYAQALYKASYYPEATRAAVRVDNPQYAHRMLMLQAAIKYEQDELGACKVNLSLCPSAPLPPSPPLRPYCPPVRRSFPAVAPALDSAWVS